MTKKQLTVLSLFDGISAARCALEKLNITPTAYYSSEIDKYAIQISKKNYPDIIQIGDIKNITYKQGCLMWKREVDGEEVEFVNKVKIDLIVAGTPCQGFSAAGKRLNFNDDRSKLFFEFVRLLKEVKPKYFLMENVRMKKEWQDKITELLSEYLFPISEWERL